MPRPVRTALLSVSDKTGLADFAKGLAALGITILSTGGTAKALLAAGLEVTDVSDITGFPEIMEGRVKTLHPRVHGGLLAKRDEPSHQAAQKAHGIGNIDLLVCNLYPFEETLLSGAEAAKVIENIDVGGPAMIRAAAKNHVYVTVVVNPDDYGGVLAELQEKGETSLAERQRLAAEAFARTASYDAAIAQWFMRCSAPSWPRHLIAGGTLQHELRYGENPHQKAALYTTAGLGSGIARAQQIQGKELSYNNINDADAALGCLLDLAAEGQAACVIVKHANPCGVAIGSKPVEAYRKALACDPQSAFGGILALSRPLDVETAEEISKLFTEVILVPSVEDAARSCLAVKKNLRLLCLNDIGMPQPQGLQIKSVRGGLLVQSGDDAIFDETTLRIVSKRQPTDDEMQDLRFAFRIVKHVKSNGIVFTRGGATLGIGAGQMSRVDAARIAARKAEDAGLSLEGSSAASDAFFPFPDGLLQLAEAGATAVIQPGGSLKDEEVIAAANAAGLAMVFTGMRHFRH